MGPQPQSLMPSRKSITKTNQATQQRERGGRKSLNRHPTKDHPRIHLIHTPFFTNQISTTYHSYLLHSLSFFLALPPPVLVCKLGFLPSGLIKTACCGLLRDSELQIRMMMINVFLDAVAAAKAAASSQTQ